MKPAVLGATLAGALAIASITAFAAEQQPLEVGLGLGFIDPGSKRAIGSDPAALLTFGTRFNSVWGAEVAAMFGNDFSLVGLRALYHLNERPGAWTPFVSFGAGITDEPGDHDTTGLIGIGVKHPINDNLGLRGEVNAHQGFDSGTTDVSLFVGLTWSWGGSLMQSAAAPAAAVAVQGGDADGDGVADSRDRCPGTAAGATVNAEGCGRDADGDGVPDTRDNCPRTPAGTKVSDEGCPLDTDGDGVTDSRDRCPGTPADFTVNAEGCVLDTDGDGVPDSRDSCPRTPAETKVNDEGCPLDGDGDGVLDSADKCPGTPDGAKVDAAGCTPVTTAIRDSDADGIGDDMDRCSATPSGAKVNADGCTLKLTQKVGITLQLNFDTDKADIKPDFADEIGKVASFMRQYPGTSVVIEGHTDNTGNGVYNQKLSQRRAEAVADSLVRDHGVAGDRVKAVGYGDTRPVADNNTSAGRAQNRRVDAAIDEIVTR